MTNDRPHELTAEECRAEFFAHIKEMVHYWAGSNSGPPDRPIEERLSGLAFSILVLLDGGTHIPAFSVVTRPHPDDKAYCRKNGENWWPDGLDIGAGVELHHEFYAEERAINDARRARGEIK